MTSISRFRLSPQRIELLENLLRAEGIERSPSQTVVPRPDPMAPVPLTFAQRRLWFLEQFAENTSAYVISAALRVRGDFRFDVFTRACEEVVRRHESLRTVFFEVDGRQVQQVRAELPPEVRIVDLRDLEPHAVEAGIQRREAKLISRPYDLTTGPLFRVELLALGMDESAVLLNVHHLVSDRWSMGVLMRELTQIYGALVTGTGSGLPELAVQYADFALWQEGVESKTTWESDLAYWTRQLRGVPSDVGLPTDRPRPKEKSYRGSSVPVELHPALVARLRDLARAEGATLFMVLVAAFKVLISRLSDGEDIVVGTPVANRTLVELEPLIGFFVNTLALRTDLSANPSFRELLRRVSKVCLEAYDHQSVPFERLVEELQPERSLARTPVFQVMFSYQNVPFPEWSEGSMRVEPIPLEARKAEFDLLLDLFEDGDTIWGRLEYSIDIFDEASVSRMVGSYRRLLRGLAADPDRRIGDLPLVEEDELAQIGAWGRGPDREWPGFGWIHECFEDHVRRDPGAVAVCFAGRNVSYGELNAAANRLARRLRRLGVGRDVLVGVCMERSVELVVALLAVLKAGGAYVPLDPGYPRVRLEFMVEDARVPVLLTQRRLLGVLPEMAAEVLCVEELAQELSGESGDDLGVVVGGEDLAYVIYTSGPTGRPKGVMNVHAGIRNRLLWMQDAFGLDRGDRVLQKTPFSFDVSVWEFFWPLMFGAALVVALPERHGDAGYLVKTIRAERVTTVHFVPSMLQVFLREPGVEGCGDLRRVICSGEALSWELQERFFARSQAELHNLYGPAEAAIDVTSWPCERGGSSRSVPIGFPIANTRLYVLDRFLRPVPVGVAGELCIGGRNVARGYMNRPGLTAERFVEDPFVVGGRLFRTGDLARYRGDGAIEYLGRLDHQVKLRGFRVELAEIEAVLARHDLVGEVVVVAREYAAGDIRLVAYLTCDAHLTAGTLDDHLKNRLPEYMVPAVYVRLPALPRTPIGTLDLAALPVVELPEVETPYVAPADDLERSIAEVWRELLGVERVGTQDNFFELGGHSLLAIKLVTQIKASHGIQLPIREIFDNPTVGGLAARINERKALPGPEIDEIPRADRTRDLPLSLAQESLCLHHPVPAEETFHNVVTGIMLNGVLDEAALQRALTDIVDRHEALRTRLVEGPDGLIQEVADVASWPLVTVDLRTTDEPARSRRLRELVEAQEQRPFRLAEDTLVRGTLVRMADRQSALILAMHHVVTDNWSYGVLVGELCELYEAHSYGREPALAEPAVQYPDYAVWQRRQLAEGAFDDQLDYWRRQLRGVPALTFAAPGDDEDAETATGHRHSFVLDADLGKALHEVALHEGATLFMVLLAAFDVLLSAYSGYDDVPVCFPEAGRERPETADLVGYFVNHLIVRTDLSGEPTFRELVDQVRKLTLDAYAHRSVPLWAVDADLVEGRGPMRILFNLLNSPIPALDLPGLRIEPLETGNGYVFSEVMGDLQPETVDLALIMREHESGLRGMWLYSLDAIDGRVLARMMRRWHSLIAWIAADPDVGIAELTDRLRRADRLDRPDRPDRPDTPAVRTASSDGRG